jgi:NADPH2:quinone reductase
MKAIAVREFGEPGVLKLEEVSAPTPAEGQVLVRVKAVGVNPVETYIRTGKYGPKPFPYTPGTDAAGVVEAVGPGVNTPKVGDRVYTAGSLTGTYAELTLCKQSQVYPLPPNVSFEQGAALGIPYATAYRGLFQRGGGKPGETLLVHGASGGVGLAAVEFARAAGFRVIATVGTAQGRNLVLEHGAHHVLDHKDPDYLTELMNLTHGQGVDLILEMLANVNLAKDLTVLARQGRVVVIGSRGTVEISPRETMVREADIRGLILFAATDAELREIHAAIAAGLANGILKPVVGKRFPLADGAKAHEAVMAPGAYGKIVLLP